jgi:hypothetical protein
MFSTAIFRKPSGGGGVERLVGVGAEDGGEKLGAKLSGHDIGVGHRQRTAPAIGRRAGVGARAVRPDAHAGAVELQNRAATRRHGVDVHHRRAHPHPGDLGHEDPLVFPGVVADIGRGAAHVEADDLLEPGDLGGADTADHAARGAGENGVLALEHARIGEAAGGLHEHQLAPDILGCIAIEGRRDPIDIAAQDRREVGIDHGGVATADHLHQRADDMADRDLGEAHVTGDLTRAGLVGGMAIAMDEDHGGGADAGVIGGLEIGAELRFVQRGLDGAVGADTLVGLDDARIQHLGHDDLAHEQLGAVLVGDAQLVGQATGDDQHGVVALALQ